MTVFDIEGSMKTCSLCGLDLPINEFHNQSDKKMAKEVSVNPVPTSVIY